VPCLPAVLLLLLLSPSLPLQPIPVAARTVLCWLVDLCCIPGRRQVAALAASCPCPPEAARLAALSEEGAYKDKVRGGGLGAGVGCLGAGGARLG
jgi:hypothetical protein